MERLRWSLFFAALSIVGFASAADNVGKVIDTRRSLLVIHVRKAGLFSAAGHEHWINAPIASGSVDEAGVAWHPTHGLPWKQPNSLSCGQELGSKELAPVSVDVKRERDAYVGTARIKQTDFGIQPIQIGGGVVKVRTNWRSDSRFIRRPPYDRSSQSAERSFCSPHPGSGLNRRVHSARHRR